MTDPINVVIDQSQLEDVRSLLRSIDKQANTALYRAINFGAKQGQKTAVDAMYAKAALTKTKIREQVEPVYFANLNRLEAKMLVKNTAMGLDQYGANETLRGVTFRIWRDGSRERYRHAFMATMPGAKGEYVFERDRDDPKYDGRFPLDRKYGPSIASLFANTQGIEEKVKQTAADKMLLELSRQMSLLMGI